MGKSLMEQIAMMSEDERAAVLQGIDMDRLVWDWKAWARPEQMPPSGDHWSIWLYMAGRGAGKPLADDTPIPTPAGWTRIADLQVGDTVFDHAGRPTKVTAKYSKGIQPAARITFRDGSSIVAALDHEWTVIRGKTLNHLSNDVDIRDREAMEDWPFWRRRPKHSAVTLHNGRPGCVPYVNHRVSRPYSNMGPITVETRELTTSDHIPLGGALQLPPADLPIDPWIFGAWLGDGATGGGSICAGAVDTDWLRQQMTVRGYTPDKERTDKRNGVVGFESARLQSELRSIGLGHRRVAKYVPQVFLRGSIEQRLDLLRGLMDTDGHIGRGTTAGAGFILESLRDAVDELATSLGYMTWRRSKTLKATKSRPIREFYGVEFRADTEMNPFSIPRKHDSITPVPRNQSARKRIRHVLSVERVPDVPVTCISVEAESSLFLAGRAMIPTHNTRSAAEWIREKAKDTSQGQIRFALVARTAADVRDVIVEGESGIISVSPPSEKPLYEPSKRRLTWPNGNTATCFTADEPDGLRGPQFHYAWADEMAAWRQSPDAAGMTSWDNLRVACRLGRAPQIIATTTPKRVPILYSLLDEAKNTGRVIVSRGSTLDNAGNLSSTYLDAITGVYAGTRLAAQELYGEMLDAVEGALWTEELIEQWRETRPPVNTPLRVIGVDPSVAENPRDECGIVVCASTADRDLYKRHAWVIEDATIHGSPQQWANVVVSMARKYACPVVAEVNQGGALVKNAILAIDPNVKVLEVHSKHGKALRAEPVVLAYEQGRVHHVNYLADLESQMLAWIPGEGKSPDRVDALVHALTALLIKPPPGFVGGQITARSVASRRLPSFRGAGGGGQGGSRGFRVR